MWESIYISGNLEKTQSTSIFPLFRVTRYQYISYIFFCKIVNTKSTVYYPSPASCKKTLSSKAPKKQGRTLSGVAATLQKRQHNSATVFLPGNLKERKSSQNLGMTLNPYLGLTQYPPFIVSSLISRGPLASLQAPLDVNAETKYKISKTPSV